MSTRVIPYDYNGQSVGFNADGWINATEAAIQFGKEPAQWLRLDSTKDYLERLAINMEKSNVEKSHITLVKTKRGNTAARGTWLHPKLAVKFARWLSVDFEIWCDEQIDQLIRGGVGGWQQARKQSSLGYRALCDALALNYEAQGKAPQRHHFINEARLINEVITGAFEGRNRDLLSAAELELVTLAELRDTALIGQGMSYAQRKANLVRYVRALQAKAMRSLSS